MSIYTDSVLVGKIVCNLLGDRMGSIVEVRGPILVVEDKGTFTTYSLHQFGANSTLEILDPSLTHAQPDDSDDDNDDDSSDEDEDKVVNAPHFAKALWDLAAYSEVQQDDPYLEDIARHLKCSQLLLSRRSYRLFKEVEPHGIGRYKDGRSYRYEVLNRKALRNYIRESGIVI